MEQKREKFSSSLAVFFATLSSAVGLGNIWMFPYVVGENGGAAFIIIYLSCVLIIGLPTLISEFAIGRSARKNIFRATSEISGKKGFGAIGILGMLSTYCMLFFYTVVAGWVYLYVFKAIGGAFNGITIERAAEMFNTVSIGPISPIVWQFIFLSVAGFILAMGVKSGIEKLTKTLMPLLIALLVLCVFTSLRLPGAMDGVSFLIKPDFSKVNMGVILSALGLAFFKLSVGTGTMITYGSYFTDDNNLISTGTKVALADTTVSILAGLAIFPAVFSFGLEPTGGPGLIFNTVPLIFSKMPGGTILLIIFFALTAMAATMATVSLLEVLTVTFMEEFKLERKKAIALNILIIMIFGSLAALSANPDGLLAHIKFFDLPMFDLFDVFVSNVLLPINGLLVVILCGYFVKSGFMKKELTNNGSLKNEKLVHSILIVVRYVTPILISLVFIKSFF